MAHSLTFSGMSLDRASAQRKSSIWLKEQEAQLSTVFIPLWRGRFLIQQNGLFSCENIKGVNESSSLDGVSAYIKQQVFLGLDKSDGNKAYFAIDLSCLSETELINLLQPYSQCNLSLPDFRVALSLLTAAQAAILSYAKSLMHWHQHSQFCGHCGTKTVSHEGGHMRQCANEDCIKQSFPRTDAVVIMLVEYQPDFGSPLCLLANHHGSPDNLVSTLAGFVDPGENLEEAVSREVKEEAGLQVEQVEYVASQPWPFPSSLMVGFFAKATSVDIKIDPAEISSANWYSAEQVKSFKNWGEEGDAIQIPREESIARYLIDCWLARQENI